MPQKVDQKFYNEAITKCSNCGSIYVFASIQDGMSIEICGNCHPFYSGKETKVDTAGRIERFMARQGKAVNETQTDKKTRDRKNKQFLGDLAPTEEVVEEVKPKVVAKTVKKPVESPIQEDVKAEEIKIDEVKVEEIGVEKTEETTTSPTNNSVE